MFTYFSFFLIAKLLIKLDQCAFRSLCYVYTKGLGHMSQVKDCYFEVWCANIVIILSVTPCFGFINFKETVLSKFDGFLLVMFV